MTYQQSLVEISELIHIKTNSIKRQAKYTTKISICLVCGDQARFINYGALSCASCKTFFRRHAFRIEKIEVCQFNGNCKITLQTRRICSTCRLIKCFSIGMSSDLIRKEDLNKQQLLTKFKCKNKQKIMQQKTMSLFNPYTLDLLNADRSIINPIDSTLFSKIIHEYVLFNPVLYTHNETAHPSRLPPKIRLKFAQELLSNLLSSFYTSLKPYIKCTNELNIFENTTYLSTFTSLFNSEIFKQAESFMKYFDDDSTLVKIFLNIISFPSNYYMINNFDDVLKTIKHLFFYQNLYTELLWKHMIFRYNYKETIFRFIGLIKHILDLISLAIDAYIEHRIYQTILNEIDEGIDYENVDNVLYLESNMS